MCVRFTLEVTLLKSRLIRGGTRGFDCSYCYFVCLLLLLFIVVVFEEGLTALLLLFLILC